jgi:hypothetical protein
MPSNDKTKAAQMRNLSLHITNEEHAALKYLAYRRFRTVNSLVREFIRAHVEVNVPREEMERAYALVESETRGKRVPQKPSEE